MNTALICIAFAIAIASFLLGGASRRGKTPKLAFDELRYQLIESPLDEKLQNDLLSVSKGCPELLGSTYVLALAILGAHKDSLAARQFALNAGRASYAAKRHGGKLTTNDERAIHNEIMVRTGSAAAEERLGPASLTRSRN